MNSLWIVRNGAPAQELVRCQVQSLSGGGGGGGGPELSWTAGGGGSELYELDDGGGGPCRLGDETKECELDGRGAR